ncbi:MAG: glycosyltransferase, partial [Casimicrobiaceae bacterium]
GSGRRHKHCCGRLDRPSAVGPDGAACEQPQTIAAALAEFRRGEAASAMRQLAAVAASSIADGTAAAAIAAAFAQFGVPERAVEFQRRAVELDGGAEPLRVLNGYWESLYRRVMRASAHATARTLLERPGATAAASASRAIHIVSSLAALGGTENRALELHALLSPHVRVTLWSVTPPHPVHAARAPIRVIGERDEDIPNGGTLVLVGTFYDYGDWLHRVDASRVIVHHNIDLPVELVQRLTQISETPSGCGIELVFPSERFRRLANLPGTIDISWTDPERFVPAARVAGSGGGLVIGRHSRDDPRKHHPNDPALYRQLVALGHRCRIMGGLPLRHAFEGDPAAVHIELLPAGAEDPRHFLATLDCFVYRKNRAWVETGGTVILEAMAMALPVIVFDDDRCGATEWIEPGIGGFVVRTEDEALATIVRLAEDPELRARIGAAARVRAVALAKMQRAAALEFYLGEVEGVAIASSLRQRRASSTPSAA